MANTNYVDIDGLKIFKDEYVDKEFVKYSSSQRKNAEFNDDTEETADYTETIENNVSLDLAEDSSNFFKEPSVTVGIVQTTGGKNFVRKQEATLTPTKLNGIRIKDLVTKKMIEEYYKNDEIDYMLSALEKRFEARLADIENRLPSTNND